LLGEARATIAAGRAPEGLEHLARAARHTAGGRDRLLVQIAQVSFCLEVGLVAAAIPILDHAIKVVDDRDLEHWDPSLACRVAELRFRALSSSDATRLMVEERRRVQLEDTRARLSRLDLGIAARILR
jgi:type VI secretion system protein VasJ